jgi:hypothetical protein
MPREAPRSKVWAGALVATVVLLGILVPGAAAVSSSVITYASGYLAPTQGYASNTDDATFANWCEAIWGAEIDKPQGYVGTAALIAPDGSWMRSAKGTGANVTAVVDPLSVTGARAYRKKAYAKNSDLAVVYAATARLGHYTTGNPGCPIPVV